MPLLDARQKEQCRLLEETAGPTILQALRDPQTIEVMLNPDGRLFVERAGEAMQYATDIDPHTAMRILSTVAGFHKREVKASNPVLECTWPLDGSRFAGQVPPIVNRPAFAIRKKAHAIFSLNDYVNNGIMSSAQKHSIIEMVQGRKNILVVGGTGTGKTTLVNAIIKEIVKKFPNDRLITIEDTAELQVSSHNYVSLFTTIHVSMTNLLKATLRLRPDRILVGETRGPETLDLLMSWNTGHPGGVATLHADDAQAGLFKMVEYISMNNAAPRVIEPLIGRAVDGIVCINRTTEGRKVQEILNVNGFDMASGQFLTTKI